MSGIGLLSIPLEAEVSFESGETGAGGERRVAGNLQLFRWLDALASSAERPAGDTDNEIAAELRRLDAKLSLVLELLRHQLRNEESRDEARVATLDAEGISLTTDYFPQLKIGAHGRVSWRPDPSWPRSFFFNVVVQADALAGRLRLTFRLLTEAERDGLERYIFREHRLARERGVEITPKRQ